MKTKIIFLLSYTLLMSGITLSFVSCEDDPEESSSVIGKWLLHKQVETITYDEETYTWGWTYDPNFDVNYFGATLLEFDQATNKYYENGQGVTFSTQESEYVVDGNSVIMTNTEDGIEYKDTLNFLFQDNMLVFYENYESEFEISEYKMYFKRFNGTIPPESWTTLLSNDNFEPDNTYDNATPLQIGEMSGQHVTVEADADWFKFDAVAGQRYLIQVSGYVDGYMSLYDTDGSTHLESDDDNYGDVDVEMSFWGNPVILWDCNTAGTYYLEVTGYDISDEGYYKVLVSNSDLKKKAKKSTSKKSKKEPRKTLLQK